jgi:pimeloyl-ACP methyl ester carboxylesterase
MKRFLKITGIIIVLVVLGLGIIFFFFPGMIVEFGNEQVAKTAGLEKVQSEINGYNVSYYISKERSQPETLVLLHGLGDDKTTFLQAAMYLSEAFNLVIPDLAGHGENEELQGADYSIYGQMKLVNALLNHIGIEQVNIAGNSMGGHTAASLAIHHPEQVKSLILINASGIELGDNVVYKDIEKIENEEDLARLTDKMFYEELDLPGPIINFMIDRLNEKGKFVNSTMIPAIKGGQDFNLVGKVQQIMAPTLIVWGKHDGIVNFNVAECYRDSIPTTKIHIVEEAAHAPQFEKPKEVSEAIIGFVKDL